MQAKQEHTQRLSEWLGLDTFGDAGLERMVDACGEWAASIKNGRSPKWLTLVGSSGVGKTHCAKRLWRWLCARFNADSITSAWPALRYCPTPIHWPSFVCDLRSGLEYERLRDMRRWPFLFLDEIGAERDTTGFAAEQLSTMLQCRDGKWTIITGNIGIEALAESDARVVSRMIRHNGIVVELPDTTMDYALRNKP